ncbi:MAG TPA: tetratricopeptide repeat protein [Bryobacteraceae bacterium]|nr:tetratricopeptide repeat protein [Bryobacteraceae bacterium]
MRVFIGIAFVAFLALNLFAQRSPDAMQQQQMRDLHDWTKNVDASKTKQDSTPLLGGPDDDPTLAADQMDHEARPAARKAALRAERLSKKKQHEEAIEEFKRALALDPQYYEAENNLALEYASAGQPDLAIQTLTRLTQTNPTHVLAFDNLAIVLYQLHRYAEAEVVARKAYKMHPFSYKANYVLGAALVEQGKWTPEAKLNLRYASERHVEAKALLAQWPAQPATVASK